MRALIDATAVPVDRGGVGRYVDNLIPALVRVGVEVRAVCQLREREHYAQLSSREPVTVSRVVERRPVRLAWEQSGLVRAAKLIGADVVHSPHYTHPLLSRIPQVVTLHDATFFTDPEVHARLKVRFFRLAIRLALTRADCCVVASQASADALVAVAGADPDQLQVAHLGVDTAVFAPPTAAAVGAVRERLGLREGQSWVAFLGTLEPRKNLGSLIRGWVAAVRDRVDPPALVLAGGSGWDDSLDAASAAVPAGLTLLRPGYLPLELLAGLLGGAVVVAYPSLGEGFGLPVLEAMACGAPVLTTRKLALPEVGGDAVAYTDTDAASIADALRNLLDDAGWRTRLGAAGLARAAGFTWEACAAAHVRAFERALAA